MHSNKEQSESIKRGEDGTLRLHHSQQQSPRSASMVQEFTELSLDGFEKQTKRVGLLYDERMNSTHNIWVPTFPENPQRVKLSLEKFEKCGLIERCVRIPARMASEEEILMKHSKEYYDIIKASANHSEDELRQLSRKYDTYFHPETYNSAMLAAGSAIEITDHIIDHKIRYGMAMLRPPGHHAQRSEANGYCFFNNAALAATHAVERRGLERVLIVDWDLHHGQGTQYMFYDDPRVMYFSIHRYEYGMFWPYLRQSDYDYIGEGQGRGFNINVPFNKTGMTDSDYMAIMQQILMPAAYEFNPQLVIVSCGFDACIGDAEGRSEVTPACYAHFSHMMKQLAADQLCILLEGGYCLKSMSEAAMLTLRCLLDESCPPLPPLTRPLDSTIESILQVIRVLRPYKKCFCYHDDTENDDQLPNIFKNIIIPKPGVQFYTEATRPAAYEFEQYEHYSAEEKQELDTRIQELISNTILYTPPNRMCIVYDERMLQHRSYSDSSHPERPERLSSIYELMQKLELVKRCKSLQARHATDEELLLIHSKEWIAKLRSYSSKPIDELKDEGSIYNSIYLCQETYNCASLAVGSTLNIIDEILTGKSRSGIALVRPPGHHAEVDCAMGFCYFNTAAIAAKYAQQKHGAKRVLILDWDVHHGNGTQHVFYDDPGILYISIHRRDNGSFFPSGDDNAADKVGQGQGQGYNVNIPWSMKGMGDAEYIAAFQQIVMPIAYEFSPDLVLVSAGFDAALGDPLGCCRVTPLGYAHMTHMLSSLANGKVALILEGGYNLNSISQSLSMCASILLGDRLPAFSSSLIPKQPAVESIKEVLRIHSAYWKCLAYNVKMPSRSETLLWLGDKTAEVSSTPTTAPAVTAAVDDLTAALAATKLQSSTPQHSTAAAAAGDSHGAAAGAAVDEDMAAAIAVQAALDEEDAGLLLRLHTVTPRSWCPHLTAVMDLPQSTLNTKKPCQSCGAEEENWVCLTCYQVLCSRFQQGHMLAHYVETNHPMVLSFSDLSVWCYPCDAYVHHQDLIAAKSAAHQDKFNTPYAQ